MSLPTRSRTFLLAAAMVAVLAAGLLAACVAPAGPPSISSAGIEAQDVWARAATMGAAVVMEEPTEQPAMGDATDEDSAQHSEMGSMAMGVNSAAYMLLVNGTDSADKLVSVSADVAKAVELHENIMEGDVMKMRQVTGGIEIPANGQVELKPGGLHVMLIGLTRDLNPGDTFPLTLQFENAEPLTVDVTVRQP